jgi:predicted ATP-grasp superfamily ATP-dependent carboligase
MRRGISNSEVKIDIQSHKWMEAVGYTGLSYIEYKLDMRDGKYKLIELNARSWLNQFLATKSGVNFPAIMYWSIIGKKINPVTEHNHGIAWVSYVEEFLSVMGELLKRKFNLREWIINRPSGKDIIFGWNDPLPGFIAPINAIRTYFKKRKENKEVFLKRLT